MATASLAKRLTRELQRGGKKTIVLALLLLVGLCIWVPMLWRAMFRKPNASHSAPSKKSTPVEAATIPQAAAPKPSATTEWKSIYRALDRSTVVQPLTLDELVRDPFDRQWFVAKKAPAVATSQLEEPEKDDSIRSLVLSAVLAGGESGAAVINDVVYKVGQEVPGSGTVRYVLKEIRHDRVVLERAGKLEPLLLENNGYLTEHPAGPDQ